MIELVWFLCARQEPSPFPQASALSGAGSEIARTSEDVVTPFELEGACTLALPAGPLPPFLINFFIIKKND